MTEPRFIRPEIARLAGYEPGEQPQEGGFIKLNTNENPYPPSPLVREIVRGRRRDLRLITIRWRPPRDATRGVRSGARPHLGRNGSDDLRDGLRPASVRAPGRLSRADLQPLRHPGAIAAGQRAVPFGADFALRRASEARARPIVCNPNSPSGTTVGVSELADLARRVEGLLVVDEAYVDFADASAIDLVREHANVLVLRTFSKSYSLAGMRIGLALGQPSIIGELAKVKDSYNLSRVSIAAATGARRATDARQRAAHPRDARAPDRTAPRARVRRAAEPGELRPGAPPGAEPRSALPGAQATQDPRPVLRHARAPRRAPHHRRNRRGGRCVARRPGASEPEPLQDAGGAAASGAGVDAPAGGVAVGVGAGRKSPGFLSRRVNWYSRTWKTVACPSRCAVYSVAGGAGVCDPKRTVPRAAPSLPRIVTVSSGFSRP